MLKRPDASTVIGSKTPKMNDPEFKAAYPTLYSYLMDTTYSDGNARATATILIFADGGSIKLCLNDRDNNRSCFIDSETFNGLLDALEFGLVNDTLTWKSKPQYNPSGNKTPF